MARVAAPRVRAGETRIEAFGRPSDASARIIHPVLEKPPETRFPAKRHPTRTTLWAWACRRCGEVVILWSKARPVKCVSSCNSFAWSVVKKQWPNESEADFLERLA